MPILKIYQGQALQATLAEITTPVQIIYTAHDEPEPDTMTALADLKTLTPSLLTTISQDPSAAVDRLIVRAETGPELVFVGAPIGLELAALVAAIIIAGRRDSGLSPETRQSLAKLNAPVHLEVFTTPT